VKKFLACALACALGSVAFAATGSKGRAATNVSPTAVIPFTTISGNPLIVNVGRDFAFQIFNTSISGGTVGQIYPSSSTTLADMGWFVRSNGVLYSPDFTSRTTATDDIGAATVYGGGTLGGVTGAGTTASPFSVTTSGLTLGATGLTASQTVTYVNSQNFFSKVFTLTNSTAAAINATVFLGSDIYLASSDDGVPFSAAGATAVGGQTCVGVSPTYTILHIATTPRSAFTGTDYDLVWSQIGAGALNNTLNTGCIDNGAALQWNVVVPANGSTSVSALTSFGDIPSVVGQNVNTSIPVAGAGALASLVLLLAAAGVGVSRRSRRNEQKA
jgi:hypothetical protein